ncbi:MAG: sporulation transcription factor Spo0A [Clostridia bacterium]|nr:sporulation transcription factor Spo0A [Clostridia bacterium]
MKIKVGFVGNFYVAEQLLTSNEVEVVFNVNDGALAYQLFDQRGADCVVTELIVPQLDGFGLIEKLKQHSSTPRIIVLTELKSEVFVLKTYEMGIADYLVKPYDAQALLHVINSPASRVISKPTARSIDNSRSLDEKLSNIFISVGIPAHIKGYQFLREGIKLAVDNPPIINSITKALYPTIAKRYDTTASKVERAIRHAIEVAWNRGKIDNINSIFGIKVYSNHERPTNGEFIALLADKMLLECAY